MTTVENTEVTEDLSAALKRLLDQEHVRTTLVRDALSEVPADMQERVLLKAEQIRTSILGQVDDIPVPEELQWTVALSYLELKSQWLQRQVRVCYEEMMTGSCSQEVAAEASMVSAILAIIEPLMTDEHLRSIQELFAQQTA